MIRLFGISPEKILDIRNALTTIILNADMGLNVGNAAYYPNIPTPYGLIIVYDLYDCRILKRAKWLHRDLIHLQAAKNRMCTRLVLENIQIKQNEYDRKEEGENTHV